MPAPSPHHSEHHHHHSHSSQSVKKHSSHRRSSHKRGAEFLYEQRKREVDKINAANINAERDILNRTIFVLGVSGVLIAITFFLIEWERFDGGMVKLSALCIVALGLYFFVLCLIRSFQNKQINLKSLIQFQETRVDNLKASLAHLEKKLEDLSEKKGSENQSDSDHPDYRQLSGLS